MSAFQPGVPISAANLNKKTVLQSSNIAGEVQTAGQLYMAMANNGSFLVNDVVARTADNTGYVYLTQGKHYHDSDTNAAGGLLSDIFAKNIKQFYSYVRPLGLSTNDFMVMAMNGTATYDHATAAIILDTLLTANNYVNMHLMGIKMSLKKYSIAKTSLKFTGATTNQFVRWGVNLEPMNLTNDNTEKYGIESCAAANGDWNLVTADGTNRTAQDTLFALIPTTNPQHSDTIENNAGVSVNFYYDTNAVVSKNTNLPSTITAAPAPANNVINYGIKTADTVGKQLYVIGLSVVGSVDDTAWV